MDDAALKEHLERTADRLPVDVEAHLEALLEGAPTISRDLGAYWRRGLTVGVAALIAAGAIFAAWELLPRGNDGTFAGAAPTGEITYISLDDGSSRFSARSFLIGDTSSRALTEGEGALPMWSPDGTMLAYAVVLDDGRVELRIQDAGETRTLLPTAHAFAWSPEGTRIAAAVGGTEWNGITIVGSMGRCTSTGSSPATGTRCPGRPTERAWR